MRIQNTEKKLSNALKNALIHGEHERRSTIAKTKIWTARRESNAYTLALEEIKNDFQAEDDNNGHMNPDKSLDSAEFETE